VGREGVSEGDGEGVVGEEGCEWGRKGFIIYLGEGGIKEWRARERERDVVYMYFKIRSDRERGGRNSRKR